MFPQWFSKWNRENPKEVFGPAILVGVAGGAVFVAAALVSLGQPYATESMQTGPRGTGMHVARFVSDLNTPDPTIESYFSMAPLAPLPDEPLARDLYQNVQVLGDLTDVNFNRLMSAMVEWVGAGDEGCAYCHGDVPLEEHWRDDLYTKVVARSMLQMTRDLNENWSVHVNYNPDDGNAGVSCYTCHRGEQVPTNVWYKLGPVNANMAGWSANQNRATVQSQFTALPSDALEKYLLESNPINVHDLDARVPRELANPATIQDTYRTYSLMNYFSNALGVNCTFCHNSRAFYDPAQNTPQWTNASLGILMVQEVNNVWLEPLTEVLPEHRLGPVFGDVPKVACATCHKGYQQPLQRADMISDWPELATTGVPVYAEEE